MIKRAASDDGALPAARLVPVGKRAIFTDQAVAPR